MSYGTYSVFRIVPAVSCHPVLFKFLHWQLNVT